MSDQDLIDAEKFAKLLFTDEQLATLLEMTPERFRVEMSAIGGQLRKVVDRGRLLTEAELRASIINQAKRGSSPAQAMAQQLLNRVRS